jgi:hypothetical protein
MAQVVMVMLMLVMMMEVVERRREIYRALNGLTLDWAS